MRWSDDIVSPAGNKLFPMRGAGDAMSVGERIAFYRQRRNLTQAVLAGMVGRSEDWLSKIERGERQARRLDVLADLARELRVTLGDLLGAPVLAEDEEQNDDVPAVRDALMAPRRLSRVLYRADREQVAPPPITWAEQHVEVAWHEYQTGGCREGHRCATELDQGGAAA